MWVKRKHGVTEFDCTHDPVPIPTPRGKTSHKRNLPEHLWKLMLNPDGLNTKSETAETTAYAMRWRQLRRPGISSMKKIYLWVL